ncbi:MAG: DUF3459 domain-containing protein [Chloroflexota bacterium]
MRCSPCRGAAYLYQGQELGTPNVDDLPEAVLQDPIWSAPGIEIRGRDGCRVPMPWSGDVPPFGFSASAATWLPVPPAWASLPTVERQAGDPASMLTLYRAALAVRRERRALGRGELRWVASGDPDVLVFDLVGPDETVRVVANFRSQPVPLPAGDVLLSSLPLEDGRLPAEAAAWILRARR